MILPETAVINGVAVVYSGAVLPCIHFLIALPCGTTLLGPCMTVVTLATQLSSPFPADNLLTHVVLFQELSTNFLYCRH
jgi:hypothetical protein